MSRPDFVHLVRMEHGQLEREFAAIALAPQGQVEPLVNALLAASKALRTELQPGKGEIRIIDGPEIWRWLGGRGSWAIARARRSCRLNAKDLKDLVEGCRGPREDLAFWAAQRPGRVVGLLAEVQRLRGHFGTPRDSKLPELRRLIEDQGGVMFWDEDGDREWRLVDTRWLVAHGDIRRWVTRPFPWRPTLPVLRNARRIPTRRCPALRRSSSAAPRRDLGWRRGLPADRRHAHSRALPALAWLRLAADRLRLRDPVAG